MVPSRHLAHEIDLLRAQFHVIVSQLHALTVRRAEFAPQFLAVYRRWHRATGRSFVAFVRELDPSVPGDKAGYQHHRSYHAALYLRRLAEAPATVAGQVDRRTTTPLVLLARAVRSVLLLAGQDYSDSVWRALAVASRWHERDLQRLRHRVAKAKPLVVPAGSPVLARQRSVAAVPLRMAKAADRRAPDRVALTS